MTPDRPNILWLCTDQQRYDTVRALGNDKINTPNIDALVASGTSFDRAYCQSPVCAPSRASFLTGRYPRTTGCRQNGQQINATERLVPRIMADQGYACGLAGKLHLAACQDRVETRIDDGYAEFHWSHHPPPDWEENAYAQWLAAKGVRWDDIYQPPEDPRERLAFAGAPAEHHQTTFCADKAIEFINKQASRAVSARSPGHPWLFSFNCFDPHHPFDPPADFLSRYDPADMPLPARRVDELTNKPRWQRIDHTASRDGITGYNDAEMTDDDRRRVTAAYYAMVELIDHNVGRMVDALRETGQLENTLVIFMSDHGEMLGDHGFYLKGPHFYESAVRVPLVVSWPGQVKAGQRSDALVELTDLAPTLLDAAGLDAANDRQRMQGRSLWQILTGKADPTRHRDAVFSEYYNAWSHRGEAYGTMLRTDDHKIVVYHGLDEDDINGELYDLRSDPNEFENLWNDPAHGELKSRMLKRCFDASVFTMDPAPQRLGDF